MKLNSTISVWTRVRVRMAYRTHVRAWVPLHPELVFHNRTYYRNGLKRLLPIALLIAAALAWFSSTLPVGLSLNESRYDLDRKKANKTEHRSTPELGRTNLIQDTTREFATYCSWLRRSCSKRNCPACVYVHVHDDIVFQRK